MQPEKQLFHQHVLIKAYVKNPPKKETELNDWLLKIVKAIDMKVCIPPRSHYVDAKGNEGLTGLIGIETSHISCHVWDATEPPLIQMDVYSCKKFKPEPVIEQLKDFNLIVYELLHIDRNKKFKIISHSWLKFFLYDLWNKFLNIA